MPGLRILLRLAPFLVGALAAAVWLRRRRLERAPLPPAPERAALVPPEVDVRAPAPAPAPEDEPAGSKPISIVTVVDDLLEIGL